VGESPESGLTRRQSVAIAFLAAIHLLPGTQRAALLLLEVAGWSAAEVAEALGITVAAVNSAAQRARATLDERAPAWRKSARAPRSADADVLGRYARAWSTGDATLLAATLRDDATLAMPPSPAWYAGRDAVEGFLRGYVFAMGVPFEMVEGPSVNGAPSLALYAPDRNEPGTLRAHSLHVMELDDAGAIAAIRVFMEEGAVLRAGLAATRARS
jgi:RNA polymerase sigma-70 factor (ECF subfamily)